MKNPTADLVREIFSYDPETGFFFWKNCRNFPVKNGTRTTMAVGSHGYHKVHIDGHSHLLHRIAWLYVTGSLPINTIDHINGDRRDNRFCNLREATQSEQRANTKLRKDNTTGFKGVSWSRSCKAWRARIQVNGRGCHLGTFKSLEEAHAVYAVAAKLHFGEFARTH